MVIYVFIVKLVNSKMTIKLISFSLWNNHKNMRGKEHNEKPDQYLHNIIFAQ